MITKAEELAAEVKDLVAKGMYVDLAAYFLQYGRLVQEAAAEQANSNDNDNIMCRVIARAIREMPLP